MEPVQEKLTAEQYEKIKPLVSSIVKLVVEDMAVTLEELKLKYKKLDKNELKEAELELVKFQASASAPSTIQFVSDFAYARTYTNSVDFFNEAVINGVLDAVGMTKSLFENNIILLHAAARVIDGGMTIDAKERYKSISDTLWKLQGALEDLKPNTPALASAISIMEGALNSFKTESKKEKYKNSPYRQQTLDLISKIEADSNYSCHPSNRPIILSQAFTLKYTTKDLNEYVTAAVGAQIEEFKITSVDIATNTMVRDIVNSYLKKAKDKTDSVGSEFVKIYNIVNQN
jgi:hypothetical protein